MLDSLKGSSVDSGLLDSALSMKPTARIDRMREAYFNFKPSGSIAKVRIETRILNRTEGEPTVSRRAKAFAAVLREMPIHIYPDQLLVGCTSVRPGCTNVSPGFSADGQKKAYVPLLGHRPSTKTFDLDLDEKRILAEEIDPYWRDRSIPWKTLHFAHNAHDHAGVVRKGFLGIKKEAEERLAAIDLTDPQELKKIPFLEGVVMVMDASAQIGKRFADKARDMAAAEADAGRKAELLKMAEVCDRVPAEPARTFYEALQSFYLSFLLVNMEVASGLTIGRMDQCLYPYYERDIQEGRITKAEAQELIDCLLIGTNYESESAATSVGGVQSNGKDATNEVSYMFIEGMMHTRLPSPWLSVLVHHQMPEDFLIKACQLSSLGTGHPHFINNDVMILQALARGSSGGPTVTLEDARSACPQGCGELVIPGKDSGYWFFTMPNLAACLELALNNGVKRSNGIRVGLETGDPRQFSSFEEVQEAYRQQLADLRIKTQVDGTKREQELVDFYPTVYESALIQGCIESGLGREDGGAHYNFNNGGAEIGCTDVADALTAIKKLVFEDKKITMSQLCDALDSNFEGHEELRQLLLKAPKFGNDDDDADEQSAWVIHEWATEFNKLTNLRGGRGGCGASAMGAFMPAGKKVGALPSGRLAGEPLADGASPATGSDLKGPTAVLKSLGKVDNVEVLGSIILNMKLDSGVVEGGEVSRLAGLIRAFIDEKIYHLNLNIVSTDTLRAAQKEPGKYRDLVVKVAGYNTFFTGLNDELQQQIIDRTAHAL